MAQGHTVKQWRNGIGIQVHMASFPSRQHMQETSRCCAAGMELRACRHREVQDPGTGQSVFS